MLLILMFKFLQHTDNLFLLQTFLFWMVKLEVVRDILVGSVETGDRMEALIHSAIYLKVL